MTPPPGLQFRGRKIVLGKRVRDALYTQDEGAENNWNCKCGKASPKQTGSEYSNLMSHVQSKHLKSTNCYSMQKIRNHICLLVQEKALHYFILLKLFQYIAGLISL